MYFSKTNPLKPKFSMQQWWKTKNPTESKRLRDIRWDWSNSHGNKSAYRAKAHKYDKQNIQIQSISNTRLQQTSTDTNTNIYRKQDQTGRTPMGRSPHREQQHKHTQAHIHTKSTFGFYFWNREQQQKHTQAYTRSLLLVSITIQLLFECLNTLHTPLVSITIQILFECLNTLHTLVVSIS